MHILHVYRTYFPDPPGGIQQAISAIARATYPLGCATTVFALSPNPAPPTLVHEEATVVRAKSYGAPASCDLGGLEAFSTYRALAHKADIVHFHFPWPFADLLHFLTPPEKPCVVTYHSDIMRQKILGALYAPLMHRTLASMARIISTSPDYAASSAVLQRYLNKTTIIPLGLPDGASASFDAAREVHMLRALGIDPTRPFILALGVLRYYKGLHSLVAACPAINAQVVIAGDGPLGAALKAQGARLGAKNLIFTGAVSEAQKRALLRACTVFVLPSHVRSEAFGLVLVEAAMFGKPLISCAINSGMSFINKDGQTGLEVPSQSPQLLAEAITTVLRDPALAKRFGGAARARYEALFSSDALGAAHVRLYKSL